MTATSGLPFGENDEPFRRTAIGMLESTGASDRHVRLVISANGTVDYYKLVNARGNLMPNSSPNIITP